MQGKAGLAYPRMLVKLSGEAFAGQSSQGLCLDAVAYYVEQIKQILALGTEVIVVIGAGNYLRGACLSEQGFDRVTADQMGMLFTIANGLSLKEALQKNSIPVELFSAFSLPGIAKRYQRDQALEELKQGKVVICAGGTGAPLFSTDTTAALRAIELHADVILKASTVDGVYTADPKKEAGAVRYEQLSYDEVLAKKLGVMDLAAICLCQEHNMPLRVFSMSKPDVLKAIVTGANEGTLIANLENE